MLIYKNLFEGLRSSQIFLIKITNVTKNQIYFEMMIKWVSDFFILCNNGYGFYLLTTKKLILRIMTFTNIKIPLFKLTF